MKYWIKVFVVLVLFSCQEEKKANINVGVDSYEVPEFNADSAYSYVSAQLDFGPRVPGSEGHAACAEWLHGKLKSFGLDAKIETFSARRFDGLPLDGKNITASINPKARKRVFICAHWDTRFKADYDKDDKDSPIPGADDGASGTAVVLELARAFANARDFDMGLEIVLFDAEDQGSDADDGDVNSWGIGAQRWSNKHKSTYNPEYGILLDMVGASGATFYRERYSSQVAPNLVYTIWKTAERMGYGNHFVAQDGRGVVDDHYFIHQNTGWPVVDIIHTRQGGATGFGSHWHTHGDDLAVIDKRVLKAVGRVVVRVLCDEDRS